MNGKNRNTEEIAAFCKSFREFCADIEKEANDLRLIASAAGGSLRDEVGQKAVQKVEEFASELITIVYRGEEPILELERRNQKMIDDMEEAKGLVR